MDHLVRILDAAALLCLVLSGCVEGCQTGRNLITQDLAKSQRKISALELDSKSNRNVAFNLIGRAGEGA